jgi:TetR/AcrR family transcriptional regulator
MSATRTSDLDVRAATLAAATRLFASRGFDGTALQDIADAVGVTKPAVLHHYPSKELIRQAVLDSILEHWNLTLPRLLVAASAGHDRFDAVFGELVRFFATDPDRARIMLREVLDRPVEMRKMLRQAVFPWLSMVAEYVRTGRDAGRHYPELDPEAYVLHVMQLVVTAASFAPVTSAFIESEADVRYQRELARIARSSLFPGMEQVEGGAPAKDESRAPRKRRRTRVR